MLTGLQSSLLSCIVIIARKIWAGEVELEAKQCTMAAKSANWALGQLNRSFHYRKADCLVPLYITFIRPKLEHAVAAWSPWTAGEKEVIENVQKRMVRMISNKRGATYEERLKNIGLTALTERRARGDMIEVFRTMKGFNNVDKNEWFNLRDPATSRATRSRVSISEEGPERRSDVIFKGCVRLDVRKHFFTERVALEWNLIREKTEKHQRVQESLRRVDSGIGEVTNN